MRIRTNIMKELTNEELDSAWEDTNPSPEERFEMTCLAYLTVADLRRIIREETRWLEK